MENNNNKKPQPKLSINFTRLLDHKTYYTPFNIPREKTQPQTKLPIESPAKIADIKPAKFYNPLFIEHSNKKDIEPSIDITKDQKKKLVEKNKLPFPDLYLIPPQIKPKSSTTKIIKISSKTTKMPIFDSLPKKVQSWNKKLEFISRTISHEFRSKELEYNWPSERKKLPKLDSIALKLSKETKTKSESFPIDWPADNNSKSSTMEIDIIKSRTEEKNVSEPFPVDWCAPIKRRKSINHNKVSEVRNIGKKKSEQYPVDWPAPQKHEMVYETVVGRISLVNKIENIQDIDNNMNLHEPPMFDLLEERHNRKRRNTLVGLLAVNNIKRSDALILGEKQLVRMFTNMV